MHSLPWTPNSRVPLSSRKALVLAISLICLVFCGISARADERVALVIGNANYLHTTILSNPLNDATDISAALEDHGFRVLMGRDSGRSEMLSLIEEFGDSAAESEIALFFFAGHAFQIDDRNFLAPIDLSPQHEATSLGGSVPLDLVMRALERAPNLRIVLLDACRDNPLGLSMDSGSGGLARVGTSEDFLIAYATQPGAVAYDGDGRNGIFTGAVLDHIHKPGQTINEMMISVRRDVIAATGGQQVPWENSSLTRAFSFDDGARDASDETLLFQIAARVRDSAIMSYYLERYPQGAHVSDAAEFLLAARSTGEASGDSSEDADALWQLARRTRQRRLAQFYLEFFPEGGAAAEAERMLSELPSETELGDGQLCERLATHPKDATAANAGVSFATLRERASSAILACQNAVRDFPEQPRFQALLARASFAAGQGAQAIQLYRSAAEAGDLRALVSLGLLHELGNGVPQNPQLALSYYERAAANGSPDGMINLAVALIEGTSVRQDSERAIELFRRASALGASEATFNLGVLSQRGLTGQIDDAFGYFERAAREGEPRGYRAAAILADRGFGVQQDFARAASLILRGAAEDRGEIVQGFKTGDFDWSPSTVRALQSRLAEAGFYIGAIDGIVGPGFEKAIEDWRRGGFDVTLLRD